MAGTPSDVTLASLTPAPVKGNISPIVATAPDLRDGTRPQNNPPEAPAFTASSTASTITAAITDGKGADSFQVRLEGEAAIDGLTVGGLNPETNYTLQVRGINQYGAGPWSTGASVQTQVSGVFAPLITDDFEGGTPGQANSAWGFSEFSDVRARSGSVSTKIITRPSQSAPTCGGSTTFAASQDLPIVIPVGKTVWQRIYHYIPSSFSMGYAFGGGDGAEASQCGSPSDGGLENMKWMRFVPDVGTARIYFQPYVARRQIAQPANAGLRVITEAGPAVATHESVGLSGFPFPRDEWFALQMAVKVSKTGDGFIRAWINNTLVAEATGISTIAAAANGLEKWGLGPYWNGQPWTDGAAGRDEFWIDEIIVASDADGYQAPTGVDPNGNAFIAPETLVGDL